jgi:leucine-rich PPR motif-containing protein
VVAYNVVIHGLCRAGCIDEAIEVRKSMVEKVFGNRKKEIKRGEVDFVINEGCGIEVWPNWLLISYRALIDGFVKQVDVDEALGIKDEMVTRGIH